MKLRTRFFLFLVATISISLLIFVMLTLRIYSSDKISFVKDKAQQEVVSFARELSFRIKGSNDPGLVHSQEVKDLFEREDLARKYLIDKSGIIIEGDAKRIGKSFAEVVSKAVLSKINKADFSAGITEVEDNKGRELVAAYASVPETGYFVIQVYETRQLNKFVILFLLKVGFAFLAIGSFFFLLGYFTISNFTKSLEKLSESAEQFGAGNYEYRIPVHGEDEVAGVSVRFNQMAKRIYDNLKSEEEKIRLKHEIETAQKVQETLFLPGDFSQGSLRLSGVYEPATECGGDWWYYFSRSDSVWVCIGDVTGHGVGSAMLTSSVRSSMSLIEKETDLTPAEVLRKLNQVICETVGGKLNMTFCIFQFSNTGNWLRYANASHEFPLMLAKGQVLEREQIQYLMAANGPRLGQSLESVYSEAEVSINGGSRLVFYSDGIFDVCNNEKKSFGERRFLKSIMRTNVTSAGPDAFIKEIMVDVKTWQGRGSLVDDVSLLCVDIETLKEGA